MATEQQYVNAAKVHPDNRTAAQQQLVYKGRNIQSVRNADFEARRQGK